MAILVAALRPARYPCQTRLLASISARTSSRPISLRRRRDRCARARARPGLRPRRGRQSPCEPSRRCRRRAEIRCACFQLPKDSPSRSGPLRGSLSHRRAEARRDWRPPSSSHDSVRQAPSALSTTLSASRRRSYTNTSAFCSGDRGDWKRCHSSRSY
jgi:hypothetical protein